MRVVLDLHHNQDSDMLLNLAVFSYYGACLCREMRLNGTSYASLSGTKTLS